MSIHSARAAGVQIPDTPHGLSVSIPTIAEVIGVEEKDSAMLSRIPTGYPRYRTHPYVIQLSELLQERMFLDGSEFLLVSSHFAAKQLCKYANIEANFIREYDGISIVILLMNSVQNRKAKDFLQHTGCHVSSRRAEDMLIKWGKRIERYPEESDDGGGGEKNILNELRRAYDTPSLGSLQLHNCGMSSIHTVIQGLSIVQQLRGRFRWVQLGWLFFDTVELFKKGIIQGESTVINNCFDLRALEELLKTCGHEVVGIITEAPSNPLMQTPDLEAVQFLAQQAGCAVVIDTSIGTSYNLNTLPYSDVVCESLTKFASGAVDTMMGVSVINESSIFAADLIPIIREIAISPYQRDINRLSCSISGYEKRIAQVNRNTLSLFNYFSKLKCVSKIFWSYEQKTKMNYKKIERSDGMPGGLLLLDVNVPIEEVYDKIPLAKGPSFGADFTMIAPQIFYSHYRLLNSKEGRAELRAQGMHRNMLRISLGTEPVIDLIDAMSIGFGRK